jgi:hypothetical protein
MIVNQFKGLFFGLAGVGLLAVVTGLVIARYHININGHEITIAQANSTCYGWFGGLSQAQAAAVASGCSTAHTLTAVHSFLMIGGSVMVGVGVLGSIAAALSRPAGPPPRASL